MAKTGYTTQVKDPRYRTMEPAILRTCGQVYREAISVLYSRNVFRFSAPEDMTRFMAQIGPTNTKLLRSLDMHVPWAADIWPWLKLLYALSREAAGLKELKLHWDALCDLYWLHETSKKQRGLGDDVSFVRALARIQGLEKLHISGFYGKNWPVYLMARTGAYVLAEYGNPVGWTSDDKAEAIKRERAMKELEMIRFMDYQRGIEDLVP